MNARWIARILAIFMLIAFIFLMANLQRRLAQIRQSRGTPTTTSPR